MVAYEKWLQPEPVRLYLSYENVLVPRRVKTVLTLSCPRVTYK